MSANDERGARCDEIQVLRARLAEAEQTIRALTGGEIDAVAAESGTTVLLAAAQQALRQRERQLRAIFEGAHDAILIADDEARYVDANPAALELFGLSREALLGRRVSEFVEPAFDFEAAWGAFLEEGEQRGVIVLVRPDGERREAEFNAKAHILPGRHLSVLRDVTERRRAHEARVRAEQRLQTLLENAPIAIFAIDRDGVFTFAEGRGLVRDGRPAQRIVGRSAHELYGRQTLVTADGRSMPGDEVIARALAGEALTGTSEIAGVVYELRLLPHRGEDGAVAGFLGVATDVTEHWRAQAALRRSEARFQRVVASNISELQQAERALRETSDLLQTLVTASPAPIVVVDVEGRVRLWNPAAEALFGWTAAEVQGRPVPCLPPDELPDLVEEVRRGIARRGREARRLRKDGTEVVVAVHAAPLRDAGGDIAGAMAVLIDVTEQRRLEEELRQTQKMDAIGRLAGGIAHDFNNVLQVIRGYVEELFHAIPPGTGVWEDLEQIARATERAGTLTRQLLAFSRKQVLQPRVLDPNALVENMNRMLRRLIGEDIELVTLVDPGVGRVKADAGQLEQVLLNLVVNARDAMPRGGTITIETSRLEIEDDRSRPHHEMQPGVYVVIAVSDTGQGMDRETQARIFEPFFTSKEQGRGTGLGLSTVYGIVKQSGGHVHVYSEPGHGTTFRVYLPGCDEGGEPSRRRTDPPAQVSGAETILIVEDEDMVRRLASRVLRRQGYAVVEAPNGEEALRVAAAHEGPIDLLLTDVIMPRMGGRELAERLLERHPGIAVVFMSGYTENAIAQHGVLEPGTVLLEKPFTPAALLRTVRSVLDASGS